MSLPQTAPDSPPDSRLKLDRQLLGSDEFPRQFFFLETTYIAQKIIGAWFARRYQNQWYGARVVETEAYLGRKDAAAHSHGGRRTPRIEPMYKNGGHLYVFFIYGMHYCANVVTRVSGVAEAVLLRAAEGPMGTPTKLLSGPGRLCKALGITKTSNGIDLLSGGDIRLFKGLNNDIEIGNSKRIGVDYAGEAANWPLRFFDRNSNSISGPTRLNRKP